MNKRFLLLFFFICSVSSPAFAQYIPAGGSGGGGGSTQTYVTQGNESATLSNSYQITAGTNITLTPASGTPNTLTITSSGGTAAPGGTNGQIQYNNAGALGGFTASGGATVNTTTGVITLGNPGASTLGGVESLAVVSHKWINTISTSGVPAATQPAFSDISGNITAAQSLALPSTDIYVGTAGNVPGAVAMSGDATIANTGAITVTASNGTAFGTAAFQNTGTSGATIPFLNGTNTFSGANTFSGILTTSSGQTVKVRVVTAAGAVTVASTDYMVEVNKGTPAATVVNLPGSPATGATYVIVDGSGTAQADVLTLTPASGNIMGASTFPINTNYSAVTITYDGTQWVVW